MRMDLPGAIAVTPSGAVEPVPAPRVQSSQAERAAVPSVEREAAAAVDAAKRRKTSGDELEKVLARLNTTVKRLEPHLEFSTAEDCGRVVVRLVDGTRNEVLRQYPTDDVIELSKRLDDLRGLLVERDA